MSVVELHSEHQHLDPTKENGHIDSLGAKHSDKILSVYNLCVSFRHANREIEAVSQVSFNLNRGNILAVVGESGSGKTVSFLAMMGLLPRRTSYVTGSVIFDGRDLLSLSERDIREIRGRDLAMIFQDPMTALNPVLSIGFQLTEPMLIHLGLSARQAWKRGIELLDLAGLSHPERRMKQHPHELSGGMRQRVMIAIALACNPKLIIADEPTTALDTATQLQILELLKDLSSRLDISLVVITHNLGIVARYADQVSVMYSGRVVETGSSEDIFLSPRHPYSSALIQSVPRLDRPRAERMQTIEGAPPEPGERDGSCRFRQRCPIPDDACSKEPELLEVAPGRRVACHHPLLHCSSFAAEGDGDDYANPLKPIPAAERPNSDPNSHGPTLSVEGLSKSFSVSRSLSASFWRSRKVVAVDDVSFSIGHGETLGLVGESGCGKTTVARTLIRLEEPAGGKIVFEGLDIAGAGRKPLMAARRKMQMIFQDPFSSLNPRMTIGQAIAEPLRVHGIAGSRREARELALESLSEVGLPSHMANRYPHELSGGQRQRAGIARALATRPSLILCDEPVSSLDVSIQGQIINLLADLKERLGLSYLFIAHDLAVVRHLSDRVIVMYLGRIVESASRDDLYASPRHPYTEALLEAVLIPDPRTERARTLRSLEGEQPPGAAPPKGCVFHARCPRKIKVCAQEPASLREVGPNHLSACHLA